MDDELAVVGAEAKAQETALASDRAEMARIRKVD